MSNLMYGRVGSSRGRGLSAFPICRTSVSLGLRPHADALQLIAETRCAKQQLILAQMLELALQYLLRNIKSWSMHVASNTPEGVNTCGAFETSVAASGTHAALLLQPLAS